LLTADAPPWLIAAASAVPLLTAGILGKYSTLDLTNLTPKLTLVKAITSSFPRGYVNFPYLPDLVFNCGVSFTTDQINSLENELPKPTDSTLSVAKIDSAYEMFIDDPQWEHIEYIRRNPSEVDFDSFDELPSELRSKLLSMISTTCEQLSSLLPQFAFCSFSLIYQWLSPGQVWHIDLRKDSWQFSIMVTDDSPTTIVSNSFLSPQDAVIKIGVGKCIDTWFTNYCSIASDITDIQHQSNPMSANNVNSGTVCMSKGGQIHRGPPVKDKFRALIFFTGAPNTSPDYNSDVQYNIFGLGYQLAEQFPEFEEHIITFLKSQLVMYSVHFSKKQLDQMLAKLGESTGVIQKLQKFMRIL